MRGWLVGVISVLAFGVQMGAALAHGGGVDAQGCHTNSQSGAHHCHGIQQSSADIKPENASSMLLPLLPRPVVGQSGVGQTGSVSARPYDGQADITLSVQYLLKALGFSPGIVDGKPSSHTNEALVAFHTACAVDKPVALDLSTVVVLAKILADDSCNGGAAEAVVSN